MGAKLAKLQTHLTAGLLSIVVVTCDRAAIPGPRHSGIISVQQSSERARPSRYAQYQRYLEYAGRDPMSQFCTRISHTAQRADVRSAADKRREPNLSSHGMGTVSSHIWYSFLSIHK